MGPSVLDLPDARESLFMDVGPDTVGCKSCPYLVDPGVGEER